MKINITFILFIILLSLFISNIKAQDDNSFSTIKIGDQVWMKENLNVEHYRNGDIIPEVQDKHQWAVLTTGAWCYYENDTENGKIYGKLYNWYAVNDPRGLAPEGWHIPTKVEFETLKTNVRGKGNSLKTIGQGSGTNTSDFSALISGERFFFGDFGDLGRYTNFWSASELDDNRAYHLDLCYFDNNILLFNYYKEGGFSVRCVKDLEIKDNQSSVVDTRMGQGSDCGTKITYKGKTYNIVKIGSQCWLKENLDIGTMIPGTQNQTNNNVIEKYCYDDKPANCQKYGGLYQWEEAMQYSNLSKQGICPAGWHIPRMTEQRTLITNVSYNGNLLKAIGQGSGTNTSGFSALLGGSRGYKGGFGGSGYYTHFWSSTGYDAPVACGQFLDTSVSKVDIPLDYGKEGGFSVRCVKDLEIKDNQSSVVDTRMGQGSDCGTKITYKGKTYNIVKIGSQCWLKENLDIGTMIPGTQNQTNNNVIEKYCYDNDPNKCNIYGGLYQWDEAMQYVTTQGAKGICPTGWHIPTEAEFDSLESNVSGFNYSLIAVGQGEDYEAGTNISGFSALLAGDGSFSSLGRRAVFWSSTEGKADIAGNLHLNEDSSGGLGWNGKLGGLSLRCLKD